MSSGRLVRPSAKRADARGPLVGSKPEARERRIEPLDDFSGCERLSFDRVRVCCISLVDSEARISTDGIA